MTTATTAEVEEYYERVRAALGFLAPDVRDELLEDLPGHLAEVSAEGDGSLAERLGTPEAYADELRAAAGLDEPVATAVSGTSSERLGALARRFVELAERFDVQAGKLIGYPRLRDLIKAAQPGWWVVRGWLVAQLVVRGRDEYTLRSMLIPRIGGSLLIGVVFTLALIAGSIWLGRRSLRFAAWPRRVVGAISVLVALWAGAVLAGHVGLVNYVYTESGSYTSPYDSVSDIHVYDKDGNLVPDARLFDQNGNPVNVGSSYCVDGNPAPGAGNGAWTFPLCPSDPGPFQAGPGAVASPGASATGQPGVVPVTPSGSQPKTAPSSPSGAVKPGPTVKPTTTK
jgi:hypothetical protein